MSKTVLTNFTPVIDALAKEHGLITAAVFGRMWRFCNGKRGVCQAALSTIAADLKLGRATVMRHVAVLVEAGYLEDLTPDLKNRPHTYRDTGKANITLDIAGVSESNSSVSERNTGVSESNMKIGIERSKENSAPKNGRAPDPHFEAVAEVCRLDWHNLPKTVRGQLNRYVKELKDVGATPEKILLFGAWWAANDWRGQKGQPPTPADVTKAWARYASARLTAAPARTYVEAD